MRPTTEHWIETAPAYRTPDEVLDLLQKVSLKHPQRLKVVSAWSLVPPSTYRYEPGRELFFHPEFPGVRFSAEYERFREQSGGYNALGEHVRSVSHPFTLSEAMRTLRLTGETRWPFDIYQGFGIRDGLVCPFRHWAVMYFAERPLQLERTNRYYLAMAANVAVERLEQFVKARRRKTTTPDTPELSDREKLVLRLSAEGLTADEIAGQLHIASGSVRTYIRRILKKLDARNVTQAVSIAWRTALFDD